MKLLVIDDDADIGECTVDTLSRGGHFTVDFSLPSKEVYITGDGRIVLAKPFPEAVAIGEMISSTEVRFYDTRYVLTLSEEERLVV